MPNPKKSTILIPNDNLFAGCCLALVNANDFITTSLSLFKSEQYKSSIALATISIEESFKGILLKRKIGKGKGVNYEDWKKLNKHQYKLVFPWVDSIGRIRHMTQERLDRAKKEVSQSGFKLPEVNINQLLDGGRLNLKIFSNFSRLREYCFYVNWNSKLGEWSIFDGNNPKIIPLSIFVLLQSRLIFNHLEFIFEHYVNRVRKAGYKLTHNSYPLPFPSYDEIRPIDKYESVRSIEELNKQLEELKEISNEGLELYEKFISTGEL